MRLLLTWSDRGSLRPPPGWTPRPAGDTGPVLRLVDSEAGPWDEVWVLTTPEGADAAGGLIGELAARGLQCRLRVLQVTDPSDHSQLFAAMAPLCDEVPLEAHIDLCLSAGTPQAQTLLVILTEAGLWGAAEEVRMLQVIPPAFVPDPHPRAWREVRLDIDGFPQIRALRTELKRLRARVDGGPAGMVARSPTMQRLLERVLRVAPTDHPVLLTGETGTGKERLARALHEHSERARRPFVAESCAALTDELLESELFGHARGAFTGAHSARKGLFELADKGTLFLDEVGEMSPRLQARLLRVLQEGTIRPVGAETSRRVDVRLICATHRDLPAMIRAGTFREDLYFRISGVTLTVPPLRARPGDLEVLVKQMLAEAGRAHLRIDPEVWRFLRTYAWPGNVRELRAEVHRWALFADHIVKRADLSWLRLQSESLPASEVTKWPSASTEGPSETTRPDPDHTLEHTDLTEGSSDSTECSSDPTKDSSESPKASSEPTEGVSDRSSSGSLPTARSTKSAGATGQPHTSPSPRFVRPLADRVAEVERVAITEALELTAGNQAEAARLLGIDRHTLRRKLGAAHWGTPAPA